MSMPLQPSTSHERFSAPSAGPVLDEKAQTPWLLLAMLIVCGFVDAVRALATGSMSGGGAVTLLGCAAVWCSWLARPHLPHAWLKSVLPLLMFDGYATGSLLWYSPGTPGVQQLAVYLSFLGFIVLTARETQHRPQLAHTLQRVLLGGSVIAAALYAKVYFDGGLGADGIVGARSYALYALVPLATSLAVWQASGQRRWLAWAGVLLALIFLSMSRTAMVAGLICVPLAIGLRGDRRSITRAVVTAAAVAAAFAAAVLSYAPLYDRFFANDASMDVGGVAVNASGRTAMWNLLFDSLGHEWVFGKGIASSANLIATYFPELAPAPQRLPPVLLRLRRRGPRALADLRGPDRLRASTALAATVERPREPLRPAPRAAAGDCGGDDHDVYRQLRHVLLRDGAGRDFDRLLDRGSRKPGPRGRRQLAPTCHPERRRTRRNRRVLLWRWSRVSPRFIRQHRSVKNGSIHPEQDPSTAASTPPHRMTSRHLVRVANTTSSHTPPAPAESPPRCCARRSAAPIPRVPRRPPRSPSRRPAASCSRHLSPARRARSQ